ncbi:glutamate-1-semialdehyde 2,1-aminomutase [Candidatus Xiphinematobacter sp. Idaho Grape]|uniref:glutamate-1-semialdehyde 2,1-aminomutase n=1 Tax=Candidatus Xiphinematobacter sp. Idaho Grape TaxID=1704307 RepID=UPI000782D1E6|nr:glutamate-1-semialdehyde 2,1-aminomutase [Candidatus Xiphinematobacter sp. Idaho Grape]
MLQSAQLFSKSRASMPGGVNSPARAFKAVGGQPFFVKHARGSYLTDVDGKKYVDYVCSWGPAILGHSHRAVVDAICAAAQKGISFGVPTALEVEMAQTIQSMVPSVGKVRMVNSGTEATMSCIRLARGFTKRDIVVKFAGCYHGHVDSLLVKAGSGALTYGQPDSAGVPRALAELTRTLPFNRPDIVREIFRREGDAIAAVILEPVPANAGLYLPVPGFLEELRRLCDHYGALLIFDEVMTGFRLAPGGAQEIFGVCPDLTALGKVIGGGLPVGAFGGRADIMDYLSPDGPVYQAGTLSGNPLSLTAGLTQIRELQRIDGWKRLEKTGCDLEKAVLECIQGRPLTFHRIGSMFCLYFTPHSVCNLSDAQKSDLSAFGKFFQVCLHHGVYLPPSQFETGFFSTEHSPEDIQHTVKVMANALQMVGIH